MRPQAIGLVHLISRPNIIGVVKSIQVRYRPVYPELRGRMRVIQYLGLHALRSCLHTPYLGEGAEETFIGCQPVDPDRILSLRRFFKGGIGDGKTPDVRNIFTKGQVAIDM